jgi:hypothetical protein
VSILRPFLLAIAVLVALTAAAQANAQEGTARVQLSKVQLFPETTATIDLELRAAGGYRAYFHASAPTDARGNIGSIKLATTYELCRGSRRCETRTLFPGLRLEGRATATMSVTRPGGGGRPVESSAQMSERITAVVGDVAGASPLIVTTSARRSPAELMTRSGRSVRRLSWSGWGGARARARGRSGGRRVEVIASRIVDCGGDLFYTRVRVRGGERVPVRAPGCARSGRLHRVHPR